MSRDDADLSDEYPKGDPVSNRDGAGLGAPLPVDQAAFGQWPAQKLDRTDLAGLVEAGEIQSVMVATPDLHGRLIGKSMPASFFLDAEGMNISSGVLCVDPDWNLLEGRFPDLGYANGWADMHLTPDWASLRRLATLDKTAIVLADGAWPDGRPVGQLPRQALKRQLARAADRGFALACAVEVEFYIFEESYESARAKNYANLKRAGDANADYSILRLATLDPLVAEIRERCIASGIPIETIKHEWGSVQLELSLTYTDALEAVDRISMFRLIARQVALKHGYVATFIARYSQLEGGSSGHVHLSVWDQDTGRSLMADAEDREQLSALGRSWVGGQMALVQELMPCFCPYVNSYKRLRSDGAAVGPVGNAWGMDVRTVPFRVVGDGSSLRVEHRIPGADANFYLALAGIIAAGLHGIEHGLEPVGEALTDLSSAGEPLPRTLVDALARFEHSATARDLLGDDIVEHMVAMGHHELEHFENEVSDVERRRSFEVG